MMRAIERGERQMVVVAENEYGALDRVHRYLHADNYREPILPILIHSVSFTPLEDYEVADVVESVKNVNPKLHYLHPLGVDLLLGTSKTLSIYSVVVNYTIAMPTEPHAQASSPDHTEMDSVPAVPVASDSEVESF